MTAYRCSQCRKLMVRPPGRCPCGSTRVEKTTLSGRGKVYSCTTLHAAAELFEKHLPFQIAIIELEEGPRLTARIQGESVKINDPVEALVEEQGVWVFALSR